MTASELASSLEGKKEGTEYRARCPVHGGRSLSISEKNGRLLVICRAGCPQREVIKALRDIGLWGSSTNHEVSVAHPKSDPSEIENRIRRADELWRQSSPIREGDPVHTYLAGRGIVLTDYSKDIRTHPALDYWEIKDDKPVKVGTYPAMVAVVRSPQGKPVGIHRTYLTGDGHKAPVDSPKKLSKVHDLTGAAVRLFPVSCDTLAIAEGVETALSVHQLYGEPCWSCISAHGMAGFIPPEGVSTVRIFADRDSAGLKAAANACERFQREGRQSEILAPNNCQTDFNDILTENAHQTAI